MAEFLSKTNFDTIWAKITNRLKKTIMEGSNSIGTHVDIKSSNASKDANAWGSYLLKLNEQGKGSPLYVCTTGNQATIDIQSYNSLNDILTSDDAIVSAIGVFENRFALYAKQGRSLQYTNHEVFGSVIGTMYNANELTDDEKTSWLTTNGSSMKSKHDDIFYVNGDLVIGGSVKSLDEKIGTKLHAKGGTVRYDINLPAKSGTIALLSDIPDEYDGAVPSLGVWGPNGWETYNAPAGSAVSIPDIIGINVGDEYVLIGHHKTNIGNLKRDMQGRLYFDIAKEVSITEIYKNLEPISATAAEFYTLVNKKQLEQGQIYKITWTGHATSNPGVKNASIPIVLITTATGSNTFDKTCIVESINGATMYGSVYASNLTCECSIGPSQLSTSGTNTFNVDKMIYKRGFTNIECNYDFINTLWRRTVVEVPDFYGQDKTAHTAKLLLGSNLSNANPTDGTAYYFMNTFSKISGYNAMDLTKSTPASNTFEKPQFPSKSSANIHGFNLIIGTSNVYSDSIGGITYNKIDTANAADSCGWTIVGDSLSLNIECTWMDTDSYILSYLPGAYSYFNAGFNCRENTIKYSSVRFIGNSFNGNQLHNTFFHDVRGSIIASTFEGTHLKDSVVNIGNSSFMQCRDDLQINQTLALPTLLQVGYNHGISSNTDNSISYNSTGSIHGCMFTGCSKSTLNLGGYNFDYNTCMGVQGEINATANTSSQLMVGGQYIR